MENQDIKEYIEKIGKKYRPEYSDFVKFNSALFFRLSCADVSKLLTLQDHKSKNNGAYSRIEISDSFALAEKFFNMYKIPIDLKELYNKKILKFFNQSGEENKSKYFSNSFGPTSYQGYSAERGKFVDIVISNNILDVFAIIHEVTHHTNQPEGNRNLTSDMLTEALSYGTEFIFAQSLLENNFKTQDAKIFIENCHRELLQYAYKINPIYRILYIYTRYNDINKEKYDENFPQWDYEKNLKEFRDYMAQNMDYIRDTWNFLGRTISLYIYSEFRKDKYFLNKLNILNNSINEVSFGNCLRTIDIYEPDDFVNKISNALDSNIDFILNDFKI